MIMTIPETSGRVKNSKQRQVQLNKNHTIHHYHFRYSRTSWLSLDSTRSDYCCSSVAHILLIVVLSVQLPLIFYSTCCSTFSSSSVPVLLPVLGFTTNNNFLRSTISSGRKNHLPFGTRTMGGVSSSPSATKSSSKSGSSHLPRMASSDVSSSGGTTTVIEKQQAGTLNEKDEQHVVEGQVTDSSAAPSSIVVHSFHEEPTSIQALIKEAKNLYESTFPQQDTTTTCTVAPGRVNLIGEHVDYTGGYVLPLAIEYSTVCYGSGILLKSTDSSTNKVVKLNLVSTMDPSNVATLELNVDMANKELPLMPSKERHLRWTNYITGVIAQYIDNLFDDDSSSNVLELTLSFCSNVPLGGGLSSSASLEVSVALWLENNFGLSKPTSHYKVNPVDRALKCQKAEHTYANTPCGIMDQYIISAGQLNSLLKIDCQDNTFESICMPSSSSNEICFVVTNSQVKHDNAGGEYPIRVKQCQDVKTIIEDSIGHTVPNLRHVTMNMLETALEKNKFINGKNDVLYKRLHHVITENERVQQCSKALQDGDWNKVGQLMTESHRSMQYDYETSCDEIDFLVDTALQFKSSSSSGSSSKIYGTRLTGGGFGGCTVTLLPKNDANEFITFIKQQYKTKYNQDCISFITTPACGVHVVDMSALKTN